MTTPAIVRLIVIFISTGILLVLLPYPVSAHCDTMNGPVVTAARKALEAGNVNLVLVWVQKADEPEIRTAFEKTLAVRRLSPSAKELADMYFFETLVRVHRAGEGVPFTGLKSAESLPEPGIVAADRALETGSPEELVIRLQKATRENIQQRFALVTAKKRYPVEDLEAGREYVKAYVEFIHYVEGLYQSLEAPGTGHREEPAQSDHH